MDEQLHAADRRTFASDLARHVELFTAADLLVPVSPMWWFSVPAMLKGWIGRVFANGVAYRYPTCRPGGLPGCAPGSAALAVARAMSFPRAEGQTS